jgi:Leucine-rich repeat (LRR) protein
MTHGNPSLVQSPWLRILLFLCLLGISTQAIGQQNRFDSASSDESSSVEPTDVEIAAAIDKLSSNNFGQRQEAQARLAGMGTAAVDHLVQAAQGDNLEVGLRCVEILVQIARGKESRDSVIAALGRLAGDQDDKDQVAALARRHLAELKMTDKDRAIAALEAAGVDLSRNRDGKVTSIDIKRDRDVAHLRHFDSLNHVALRDAQITDAALPSLSYIRALRILRLSDTSVTSGGLNYLADLSSLESLYLENVPITSEGMRSVGKIASLGRLSLDSEVDDSQLEQLQAVRQIKTLSLDDVRFTSKSAGLIDQLDNVRSVEMSLSGVSDHDLGWLAQIEKPISSLSISRSPDVTDAGWANLENSQVESLHIRQTPVSDSALASLAATSTLTGLHIYDTPLTAEGVMNLKSSQSLRHLVLRGTTLTKAIAARLQGSIPTLISLRVESGDIRPRLRIPIRRRNLLAYRISNIRGRKHAHVRGELTDDVFEKLKAEQDLHTVFLSYSDPSNAHVEKFVALPIKGIVIKSEKVSDQVTLAWKDHATLESLSLDSPNLGDKCLEPIVDIPLLNKLQITDAKLTDLGVQTLIRGLAGHGKLTWLSFRSCPNLTNDAFQEIGELDELENLFVTNNAKIDGKVLAQIGQLRELTGLGLSGMSIEVSNLEHLEGLKLTRLDLYDAQLSSEAVEKLVALFPDLTSLGGSKFTDADMVHIGKLTRLKSLNLMGSQVGDEGLAKLDGLTELTYVSGNKDTISDYGKRQFERTHPKAKIFLLNLPTR